MNDYRLDGLDPRAFEHLVQALAYDAITALITPFGDGPDGGREATFDGPTNYGPTTDRWSGYGLLQAKFLRRPRSAPLDGRWAIKELKAELRKFTNPGNRRRIPEYFIFATNVTLTATAESGSKDKVFELLAEFAERFQLKGFDVWDYDKLRLLLDHNEDVRMSYAAWITPGDVLAELARHIKSRERDYYKLIVKFLQRELLSDQFARLEQAGHSADEAIPLSQVFVDLPTSAEPTSPDHDSRGLPGPELDQGFVATLIGHAASSFANHADPEANPGKGRFVLIGGPGQGKTTLGQFVCQVFRAALLQDVPPLKLAPEVATAIGTIRQQWKTGSLPEPTARRIPFRIVLSEFAAAMASNKSDSVLSYIALKFSSRVGVTVSAEEMERLLVQYPSVLVLDGLDEVPASTNREDVLSAVSSFWIDIATANMDILVVATSRPQGYNQEFSPKQYVHRYLVPLAPRTALDYGQKLAQVRFGGDPDRVNKIVSRLQRAATTPATARLMRSPLQVTILTLLVDRVGSPPEERWALFRAYYDLIYARETERDIASVRVLKEHPSDVHAIHRRVGLLLQVASEKSGGTEARLTLTEFSQIVEEYLIEEGHEGNSLSELKRQIIEAAGQRLVFLVGLEINQIGFEIRSLQEFMAAEGLMEGQDSAVQDRLKQAASSTNWRNVFLFAAGRCFEDRRHLRDTIESICFELNDDPEDPLSRALRTGSELALDLLEDGPARRQPHKRRSLSRLALQLLDRPSSGLARRLAGVYLPETSDIFLEEIEGRIGNLTSIDRKHAAWECLVLLAETHGNQFEELIQRSLSEVTVDAGLFSTLVGATTGKSQWLSEFLLREYQNHYIPGIMPQYGVTARQRAGNDMPRRLGPWVLSEAPEWLRWTAKYEGRRYHRSGPTERTIRLMQGKREIGVVRIHQSRMSVPQEHLIPPHDFPVESPAMAWLKLAGEFTANPDPQKLADLIHRFNRNNVRDNLPYNRLHEYPWPLAECVESIHAGADPEAIANFIREGGFGDRANWQSVEDSWENDGVEIEELVGAPPALTIRDVPYLYRFPLRALKEGEAVQLKAEALIRAFDMAPPGPVRTTLATLLLDRLHPEDLKSHNAQWYQQALLEVAQNNKFISPQFFSSSWSVDLTDYRWSELFASLPVEHLRTYMDTNGMDTTRIEEAIIRHPNFTGLLVALAFMTTGPRDFPEALMSIVHDYRDTDSSIVRAARVLLRLANRESVDVLNSELREALSAAPLLSHTLARIISVADYDYPKKSHELLAMRDLMPVRGLGYIGDQLRRLYGKRQSRFDEASVWRKLQLPNELLALLSQLS
ncbi:hypothetical protein [Microbispora sp. NPDC046933]|uniref:NACHT domain-containing protein n=1 Tax=Microbispora sp. NPDC046933 TaxID=3155618 RepID=UPI0033C7040A